MSDLTSKITALEEQLENLRRQKLIEDQLELSVEQKMAIELHAALCTWNHTDGCAWGYEIKNKVHDWNGGDHGSWLLKAGKFLKYCEGVTSPTVALELVKFTSTLKGY